MDPLRMAVLFHDIYEKLAPQYGYETRSDTKQFDPTTPNGKLMIATCREILKEIDKPQIEPLPTDMIEEGWLPYGGWGRPVFHNVFIAEYMHRTGDITKAGMRADIIDWNWSRDFPMTDIVAYRVEK